MSETDTPRKRRWSAEQIRDANVTRGPESPEKAAWYVEQGVMTAEEAVWWLENRRRFEAPRPSTVYATKLAACLADHHGLSYPRLRRVVEIATGCVIRTQNTGSYVRQGRKARKRGDCPYHSPIPPTIREALIIEEEEYREEMAVS